MHPHAPYSLTGDAAPALAGVPVSVRPVPAGLSSHCQLRLASPVIVRAGTAALPRSEPEPPMKYVLMQ